MTRSRLDRAGRAAQEAETYLCHAASKYGQALDRVALDARVKADSGAMRAHDHALSRLRDAAYSLVRAETDLERATDESKGREQ